MGNFTVQGVVIGVGKLGLLLQNSILFSIISQKKNINFLICKI